MHVLSTRTTQEHLISIFIPENVLTDITISPVEDFVLPQARATIPGSDHRFTGPVKVEKASGGGIIVQGVIHVTS